MLLKIAFVLLIAWLLGVVGLYRIRRGWETLVRVVSARASTTPRVPASPQG
jgi:hypothetical protein